MAIKLGDAQLHLSRNPKIPGQYGLYEAVLMQGQDRVSGTRICRLLSCEFRATIGHDLCHDLVKTWNPGLGQLRLDARADCRIHDDGLVRIAVHPLGGKHDGIFLNLVRTSDGPSQPTKIGGDQGSVHVPHHKARWSATHLTIVPEPGPIPRPRSWTGVWPSVSNAANTAGPRTYDVKPSAAPQ